MGTAFEHPESPRLGARFVAFGVIAVVLFTVLAGRLFQLQVIEGTARAEEADGGPFGRGGHPVPARAGLRPRGPPAGRQRPDLDRRRAAGRPARRTAATSVLNRVADGHRHPGRRTRRRGSMRSTGHPLTLSRWPRTLADRRPSLLAEESAALPGISLQVVPRRQYLNERGEADGTLLAHVVGYTGPINAEELDAHGRRGLPPRRRHRPHRGRGRLRRRRCAGSTDRLDGSGMPRAGW